MEVRYTSEDVDYEKESEDFYEFQQRVREIPEDFCHKDRHTTSQACFFCLVCDCDLKSLKSLKDHVEGNKHIRKACEKKRQIMGIPSQPQNAPRIKKIKKEQPRVDVNKTLEERLKDSAQPAIGLEYITEYRDPNDKKAHRMYTCSLTGCKSAWGTSDDMYNHTIKPKHHRNYFKQCYPDDSRIAGLSNADILSKATEEEEKRGGYEERDYGVIVVKMDYALYKELRDRPDDWSEKKAKLGMVGKGMNSNMEPLGKRGSKNLATGGKQGEEEGGRKRPASPSIWDEGWKDWRPKSPKTVCNEWIESMKEGVQSVEDMVENFEGKKNTEEYEDVQWYFTHYRSLIELHEHDYSAPEEIGNEKFNLEINDLKRVLNKAEEALVEKTEWEEKHMKHVGALLAEVEDEMERYDSSRESNKYNNIKHRLSEMTKEMNNLNPAQELNKQRKEGFKKRLASLWTKFEDLSDNISDLLERQLAPGEEGRSRGEQREQARKTAVAAYRNSVLDFVCSLLDYYSYKNPGNPDIKIGDQEEFQTLANYVTEKIVKEEVNSHIKRGGKWDSFLISSATKEGIRQYIPQKMARYQMRGGRN